MPPINVLKNTEILAKAVGSSGQKIRKAAAEPEVMQKLAMPSAETLRGYTGVKVIKMYAGSESVAKHFGLTKPGELNQLLKKIDGVGDAESLNRTLSCNRISEAELAKYVEEKCFGGTVDQALAEGILKSKEIFLRDLIADVQAYPFIKNNPVFEPYNLGLAESSEILNILRGGVVNTEKRGYGQIDFATIQNVLKSKNPELYEILGGSEIFTEQTIRVGDKTKTIIPSRTTLLELQDNVCGINSVKKVIESSDSMKFMNVDINGSKKMFLYTDELVTSTNIPKMNNRTLQELVKSNMLTLDLIKSPEFKALVENNPEVKAIISNKRVSYKNPTLFMKGEKTDESATIEELIKKIEEKGIDSLNSFEIHAITDTFENVLTKIIEKNKRLKKIPPEKLTLADEQALKASDTTALIKSLEPKSNKIYSVIQGMKETVKSRIGGNIDKDTKIYSKDGIKFEDHFFMRMIDRDLANVTENESGKILTTAEIVDRIVNTTKNGIGKKDIIPGVQGHGISLITAQENGATVIRTLMQ